ncbi:hypothetical protein [Methylotuvimicrobium sp. KM1]|uniref:hypothetical protein n=1 Tax=Methylotuvimicrobium sp. KM1 TaxID=3377707 RepID=UPI0038514ADC
MIKKTLIYLAAFAFLPISSHAQFGNMTEAQMQQMMQQGLKMQECFGQIDSSAMERLSERGQSIDAEITALCRAGNRDQAQSKAMAFALEMANDPAIQAMKKCGEGMADMLPKIVTESEDYGNSETSSRHVCDNR